jgi:hypothetical protein
MRIAIAIALSVVACGGTSGPDTDVACGPPSAPISCSLDGNVCCTKLNMRPPADDYCQPTSGGACMTGFVPETCDGPEDCGAGQLCCASVTAIECTASSSCAQDNVVCHDHTNCANGYACCIDPSVGDKIGFCGINCPGGGT